MTKKYFAIIFLFIFLICSISSFAFADAEKIFKENNKSVVVVLTFDNQGEPQSQGSGFIVRSDGAVVTNYHVVSNSKNIQIKIGSKILDVEGIIHTDKENDLVIIKAKGKNLATVRLGDIEKETVGEKIYVISSPKGLENTISDGLLSGIREVTDKKTVLQITAPVSPGSSGSPVFNENGEVIGITTFLLEDSQNLNFAMPVNLIRNKINNKGIVKFENIVTEDYTKTADYWQNIGIAYIKSGKCEEAVNAFKQAIKIDPDYEYVLLNNIGVCYTRSSKYQEAIETLKQAIRIKPDFVGSYDNLGYAYEKSGMFQKAVNAFKQAIRIDPDYAQAHYGLGYAYYDLDKYQEAVNAFKQAIRIDPDYAQAHLNLGVVYVMINDNSSAMEEYKVLKELDIERANKLFNLIYP